MMGASGCRIMHRSSWSWTFFWLQALVLTALCSALNGHASCADLCSAAQVPTNPGTELLRSGTFCLPNLIVSSSSTPLLLSGALGPALLVPALSNADSIISLGWAINCNELQGVHATLRGVVIDQAVLDVLTLSDDAGLGKGFLLGAFWASQTANASLSLEGVRVQTTCQQLSALKAQLAGTGLAPSSASVQVSEQAVWVQGSWTVGRTALTNTSFVCSATSSTSSTLYAEVGSAAVTQPGALARALSIVQVAARQTTLSVRGVTAAEGPWGGGASWPISGFNLSAGPLLISGNSSSQAAVLDMRAVPVLLNLGDEVAAVVTGITLTNLCYWTRSSVNGTTSPLISFGLFSVVHRWGMGSLQLYNTTIVLSRAELATIMYFVSYALSSSPTLQAATLSLGYGNGAEGATFVGRDVMYLPAFSVPTLDAINLTLVTSFAPAPYLAPAALVTLRPATACSPGLNITDALVDASHAVVPIKQLTSDLSDAEGAALLRALATYSGLGFWPDGSSSGGSTGSSSGRGYLVPVLQLLSSRRLTSLTSIPLTFPRDVAVMGPRRGTAWSSTVITPNYTTLALDSPASNPAESTNPALNVTLDLSGAQDLLKLPSSSNSTLYLMHITLTGLIAHAHVGQAVPLALPLWAVDVGRTAGTQPRIFLESVTLQLPALELGGVALAVLVGSLSASQSALEARISQASASGASARLTDLVVMRAVLSDLQSIEGAFDVATHLLTVTRMVGQGLMATDVLCVDRAGEGVDLELITHVIAWLSPSPTPPPTPLGGVAAAVGGDSHVWRVVVGVVVSVLGVLIVALLLVVFVCSHRLKRANTFATPTGPSLTEKVQEGLRPVGSGMTGTGGASTPPRVMSARTMSGLQGGVKTASPGAAWLLRNGTGLGGSAGSGQNQPTWRSPSEARLAQEVQDGVEGGTGGVSERLMQVGSGVASPSAAGASAAASGQREREMQLLTILASEAGDEQQQQREGADGDGAAPSGNGYAGSPRGLVGGLASPAAVAAATAVLQSQGSKRMTDMVARAALGISPAPSYPTSGNSLGVTTTGNSNTHLQKIAAMADEIGGVREKDISERLTLMQPIGQGGFGQVYKGRWRGLEVAVKTVLFSEQRNGTEQRAIMEAAVCASVVHPNVVCTYHYDITPVKSDSTRLVVEHTQGSSATMDYKLYLVQELCNATLKAVLNDCLLHSPASAPDMDPILTILGDIARGMDYIHSKNIIHGDLKPENVLLKVDKASPIGVVAKISDFGLAKAIAPHESHLSGVRGGTPFYQAPETVHKGMLTKTSDVYSFGVLMWESYRRTPPWVKKPNGGYHHNRSFGKFAPDTPVVYQRLCRRCLDPGPRNRPTFREILAELDTMLNAYLDGYDELAPPGAIVHAALADGAAVMGMNLGLERPDAPAASGPLPVLRGLGIGGAPSTQGVNTHMQLAGLQVGPSHAEEGGRGMGWEEGGISPRGAAGQGGGGTGGGTPTRGLRPSTGQGGSGPQQLQRNMSLGPAGVQHVGGGRASPPLPGGAGGMGVHGLSPLATSSSLQQQQGARGGHTGAQGGGHAMHPPPLHALRAASASQPHRMQAQQHQGVGLRYTGSSTGAAAAAVAQQMATAAGGFVGGAPRLHPGTAPVVGMSGVGGGSGGLRGPGLVYPGALMQQQQQQHMLQVPQQALGQNHMGGSSGLQQQGSMSDRQPAAGLTPSAMLALAAARGGRAGSTGQVGAVGGGRTSSGARAGGVSPTLGLPIAAAVGAMVPAAAGEGASGAPPSLTNPLRVDRRPLRSSIADPLVMLSNNGSATLSSTGGGPGQVGASVGQQLSEGGSGGGGGGSPSHPSHTTAQRESAGSGTCYVVGAVTTGSSGGGGVSSRTSPAVAVPGVAVPVPGGTQPPFPAPRAPSPVPGGPGGVAPPLGAGGVGGTSSGKHPQRSRLSNPGRPGDVPDIAAILKQ